MRLRLASVPWLALALIASCSTSRQPNPTSSPATSLTSPTIKCSEQLRKTFAEASGSAPLTVEADVSAGYTTCDYKTAATPAASCTAATVSINTAPQAFTDFNRWVVETTQNAGSGPVGHAPEQINGIGLLADWVPATLLFETATQTRWIAVQLTCMSPAPKDLALATDLAQAALSAR
jgi:hypothetical protein